MPPYTNVWDVTQPPDTQPANLLGQDLRNLKTDIMQRMFLSGTLANRPTPDSGANANFTGVIYIATDTGQAFSWTGAAWVQISLTSQIVLDFDNYTMLQYFNSGPGNNHVVQIPVGAVQSALPIGSFIEFELGFSISAFTGAAPTIVVGFNQAQPAANFTVGVGASIVRGIVALQQPALPIAYATCFTTNAGVTTSQVFSNTLLTQIDGSVQFPITDLFGGATTISAIANFLHVRVRK